MKLKKIITSILDEYLNEQVLNNLTVYRGEKKQWLKPTNNDYSFFSEDERFAKDYGDYLWKCILNQ